MTKNSAWASKQFASRISLTTEIEDDICSLVFDVVVVVVVIVQDEQCQQSQDLWIQSLMFFNRFIGCIKRRARFHLQGLCSQSFIALPIPKALRPQD